MYLLSDSWPHSTGNNPYQTSLGLHVVTLSILLDNSAPHQGQKKATSDDEDFGCCLLLTNNAVKLRVTDMLSRLSDSWHFCNSLKEKHLSFLANPANTHKRPDNTETFAHQFSQTKTHKINRSHQVPLKVSTFFNCNLQLYTKERLTMARDGK